MGFGCGMRIAIFNVDFLKHNTTDRHINTLATLDLELAQHEVAQVSIRLSEHVVWYDNVKVAISSS